MKSLESLAATMQTDWDRRVRHDYRFWISNELSSGSLMWEEGARDFESLAVGIPGGEGRVALEIGCGVGRMLRAAAGRFGKVIGVDISTQAIEKARELTAGLSNVSLVRNSGYDLADIADHSIDFAYSFAALSHMPVRVIASYLAELQRTLRPSGCARLQIFRGLQDGISESDSLRLRAFTDKNIRDGMERAGFAVRETASIDLPMKELLDELGLEAIVVTLVPTGAPAQCEAAIASALQPSGECESESAEPVSTFEAWLALNYADKLYANGDFDRARSTLEYVARYCHAAGVDVRDTLEKLANVKLTKVSGPSKASGGVSEDAGGRATYEANVRVIQERFPKIAAELPAWEEINFQGIEIKTSVDGPVLWRSGTCFDHPEKPRSGAETWARRSLNESRMSKARHLVVVGFGCGYHIENLLERGSHDISCVEPSREMLCAALAARDLTSALSRLRGLSFSTDEVSCDEGTEIVVRPQVVAVEREAAERVTSAFYGRRGLSALHPKIAVLGPLHGGSLPIGQYTTAALSRLGQRVRGIDMSGFNGAYELVPSLVFEDSRRDLLRQTYVETLSSMLLESFAEKPIDILICMAQAPLSARALLELRKRGVVTVLWFVEDYLRFTYWREMAKYYDFVFTIQKGECLEAIKAAGAGHVHYLPTACDPHFHAPLRLSPEEIEQWGSPISFVGAGYHNRQQMFAALTGYQFKIWGSEWPMCKPFDRMVQQDARRIAPEEYLKIFNATDVNLNLHSSSERDGVDPTGDFLNPRTFELAASGAFQLVDERALLPEAFTPGEEVITFSSLSDLKEKIDYYLARPEERRRVAERGRVRALRDHTYDKRLEEMLTVIYSHAYQKLKQREEQSPWLEMIRRAEVDPELQARCERAFLRGDEPVLDGLVADIVTGQGQLTETEQKLLFLFHVRKQITRMEKEGAGVRN